MRALALIAAALLLCAYVGTAASAEQVPADGAEAPGASAEAILENAGFDGFAAISRRLGGIDARKLLERALTGKLEWDEAWAERIASGFAAALKSAFLDALAALAVPVLAGIALRALLGGGDGCGALGLLCRLCCAALLTARYVDASRLARDMLSRATALADAAAPVLAAVLTATGRGDVASVLSPMSALCASVAQRALAGLALPLCGVAATVAASANLSERFRLNRLFALLKQAIVAGVRLVTAAFAGVMAVEGLLASGQDALSARVLQRAIQGALPIVGGHISDSAGALMASAAAIRNAVGVAGAAAVLGACAGPIAKLGASMLSLRLAAAVLEPVADPGAVAIIGHFSELSRMLLAICAGCAALALLLIGACLGMAAGGAA